MKGKSDSKQRKGTPAKKKTPAWTRYKTEDRFYHHKVATIQQHLKKYPNDKGSISRLQSVKDKRFAGK